jgi:hypothetical protein
LHAVSLKCLVVGVGAALGDFVVAILVVLLLDAMVLSIPIGERLRAIAEAGIGAMSAPRGVPGCGHITMKPTTVPEQLTTACRGVPERMAWLERLPGAVQELQGRWSLSLGPVWHGSASCAWVAPAVRADGTRVVLKLGMPHMEVAHEIDGLRFWDGDPMVRLLEADASLNAMRLERCEPGTPLRAMPETEQDLVLARLLRRLWRRPSTPHPFRPLRLMVTYWVEETRAARAR